MTDDEGGGQDGSHAWEESWIFYDVTPEQYESVWNVSHTNEIIWEFGKNSTGMSVGGYDKAGQTPAGDVVFPDTIQIVSGTFPVTQISGYALKDCTEVKSAVVPDGVTTIGESAFSGCTSLTKVFSDMLAENLKKFGEG